MAVALDAGADDVIGDEDGAFEVLVSPDGFDALRSALIAAGLAPESAEVTLRAGTSVSLEQDDAEKMIKLLERLDDLDDVQNVYSNAAISEDILAKLG